MRLACPFCGDRSVAEFSYMGDATLKRPDTAAQEEWVDYVYMRTNPAGPHAELWYHEGACRQIFEVQRDTRTHEILT
jgi:sarcosine oxidase subunit delta